MGRAITNPANRYDLSSASSVYGHYCNGPGCSSGLRNLQKFMKEQGASDKSVRDPCKKD